jgi:hypothetical protein
MAESKKGLTIQLKGKLDSLVIKEGGRVLYSYKKSKPGRKKTSKQVVARSKTSVAGSFASCLNKISCFKRIWKNWPVKGRPAYRNMVAANIKFPVTSLGYPTSSFKIVPMAGGEVGGGEAIDKMTIGFIGNGMEITVPPLIQKLRLEENGNTITVIGIVSVYNPVRKNKKIFDLFSCSKEIQDYRVREENKIGFEFSSEEKAILSKYKNCIIYGALVISKDGRVPRRWSNQFSVEYDLTKN